MPGRARSARGVPRRARAAHAVALFITRRILLVSVVTMTASTAGPSGGSATLTAKLAAAASAARAAADAAKGEQLLRPPANNSAVSRTSLAAASDAGGHPAAAEAGAAAGARAGRGRQLPEWWWLRQLQKQKEKDDEFARILEGRLGDGESDVEPVPATARSAPDATPRARNISAMSGRVLGSGQVVVGNLSPEYPHTAAVSALPPTEMACSVRVKRLRKFSRLERFSPHQDPEPAPKGCKSHPHPPVAPTTSSAANGGGGGRSDVDDGRVSPAPGSILGAHANVTVGVSV